MDSSVLYKDPFSWTNEEMDWMEDECNLNPTSCILRRLEAKRIPVSINITFFTSQNKLKWLDWNLIKYIQHYKEKINDT